jgi:NDP-sugar pyrophosphorylase family protein
VLRHALVLTAGLGTRLEPLTAVRAKPAIPVGGEAMIRRIIGWLASHGVTELVLNLHHLPHTLSAAVGDGSDLGVRVRYSWEQPQVLGSAGGPRHALSLIGADTFFVINGDTLTDLDVQEVAAAHEASGALVTLAVVPNREPHRYGGVRMAPDGSVAAFVGSPDAEGSGHFIGVQVVRAEVFRELPDGEPRRSFGDVYDRLVARRPGSIRAWMCDASFQDIGTVGDYWATSTAFLDQEHLNSIGRGGRLDPTARVTRSILWDDVEVGAGSTVDECIVTDGVRIPAGSAYRRAILLRGTNGPAATPLVVAP